MGGGAGEIQERRIRHHLAADRSAAHRDRGCDARLARGQGLFRRRQTLQRSRGHRSSRRDEARDRGAARPARRSARPRQGRARRIQARRSIPPNRPAAAEAKLLEIALRQKRDEISQADASARTRNARGDVARRRHRGEDAADAGADLCRYRTLRRIVRGGAHRDQAAAQFGSRRGRPRTRRRRCSRSSFSARRATTCRRSTRWRCSTNIAN